MIQLYAYNALLVVTLHFGTLHFGMCVVTSLSGRDYHFVTFDQFRDLIRVPDVLGRYNRPVVVPLVIIELWGGVGG